MTELDYRRRMELATISRDAWIQAAGAAEKANVALQAENERLRETERLLREQVDHLLAECLRFHANEQNVSGEVK